MPPTSPLPVRCPPGPRWACTGCAACCERFELGPLDPGELAALEAADLPARWPAAARDRWWEERPGPGGAPAAFLTRRRGACVFLDPERRCALHRLLGEDKKPAFCRIFPFQLIEETARVTATVRPLCAGWHASRHTGPPLAGAAEALVAAGLPRARIAPAHVGILPGAAVGVTDWDALEPALLGLIARAEGDPEVAVAAIRRGLQRATGRPETRGDPAIAAGARALTLSRLRATLAHLAAAAPAEDPRARLLLGCLGWFDRLDPSAAPPPCTPDGASYLGMLLESLVFGRGSFGPGGLPRALGAFLLDTWIARSVEPGSAPTGAALAGRLAAWGTIAAHAAARDALRGAAPSLDDLFLHAEGP